MLGQESEETEGRVRLLGLLIPVDSLPSNLLGGWLICRRATEKVADAKSGRFLALLDLFSLVVLHRRLDLLDMAWIAAKLG